jgi:hypothetical protein
MDGCDAGWRCRHVGPGAIERLDVSGKLTSLSQAPYFPRSLVFDGTDFFETVGKTGLRTR